MDFEDIIKVAGKKIVITIIVTVAVTVAVLGYLHYTKKGESKMTNEIFTIVETDQYKFEAITNAFLQKNWVIFEANFFPGEVKDGLTLYWVAILERGDSGLGVAKEVEKRAIEQYINQKEER